MAHGKKCQGCIRRCPVGAITEAGHDKKKAALKLILLQYSYILKFMVLILLIIIKKDTVLQLQSYKNRYTFKTP
jgi:ferredoxin